MTRNRATSKIDVIQNSAQREASRIIKIIREIAALKRKGPAAELWWVDIQVCGSIKMKKENMAHRSVDGVTDILSFPSGEPFFSSGCLGSLLICAPILKKQARDFTKTDRFHSEKRELQVLLIHGLLHLLGFDHERPGPQGRLEAGKMRRMEIAVANRVMKRPKGLIERTLIG